MPLSTISNGASSATARTAINAAITRLNYTNGVGHVDPTAGSNTTGDGSFLAPYATVQKAVTEGFTNILICAEGDAGTLMLDTGSIDHLHIYGVGACDYANASAVDAGGLALEASASIPRCELTLNNGTNTNHIHVYSNKGVLFHLTGELALASGAEHQFFNAIIGEVSVLGAVGTNGTAGANGANGGTGEAGGDADAGVNGAQGGPGGILYAENCLVIGPVDLKGGVGGNGGNGGNGGAAGAENPDPLNGGNGGNGGDAGAGGNGGVMVARWSIVACVPEVTAGANGTPGSGGSGGAGSGSGNPGANGSNGGTIGSASAPLFVGELSSIKDTPVGVTPTYRGSVVAGSFVATSG